MWKRALLSLLLNIGIFFCLLGAYYGIESKQYILIAAGGFGAAVLIGLKVRLIRAVRDAANKP